MTLLVVSSKFLSDILVGPPVSLAWVGLGVGLGACESIVAASLSSLAGDLTGDLCGPKDWVV